MKECCKRTTRTIGWINLLFFVLFILIISGEVFPQIQNKHLSVIAKKNASGGIDYAFDWSSGDSWVNWGGINMAGGSSAWGRDSLLAISTSGGSSYHRGYWLFPSDWLLKTMTISFDYYMPSGNGGIDGFDLRNYTLSDELVNPATTDAWTNVEATGVYMYDQSFDMIAFYLLDGGTQISDNNGDSLYISRMTVVEE